MKNPHKIYGNLGLRSNDGRIFWVFDYTVDPKVIDSPLLCMLKLCMHAKAMLNLSTINYLQSYDVKQDKLKAYADFFELEKVDDAYKYLWAESVASICELNNWSVTHAEARRLMATSTAHQRAIISSGTSLSCQSCGVTSRHAGSNIQICSNCGRGLCSYHRAHTCHH